MPPSPGRRRGRPSAGLSDIVDRLGKVSAAGPESQITPCIRSYEEAGVRKLHLAFANYMLAIPDTVAVFRWSTNRIQAQHQIDYMYVSNVDSPSFFFSRRSFWIRRKAFPQSTPTVSAVVDPTYPTLPKGLCWQIREELPLATRVVPVRRHCLQLCRIGLVVAAARPTQP